MACCHINILHNAEQAKLMFTLYSKRLILKLILSSCSAYTRHHVQDCCLASQGSQLLVQSAHFVAGRRLWHDASVLLHLASHAPAVVRHHAGRGGLLASNWLEYYTLCLCCLPPLCLGLHHTWYEGSEDKTLLEQCTASASLDPQDIANFYSDGVRDTPATPLNTSCVNVPGFGPSCILRFVNCDPTTGHYSNTTWLAQRSCTSTTAGFAQGDRYYNPVRHAHKMRQACTALSQRC